jgi:hypothetical protein
MLRRIFGSKREEVAGGWRRLHNEELHNLYASPNFVMVIKSRRDMWHALERCKMHTKILVGKPERKRPRNT